MLQKFKHSFKEKFSKDEETATTTVMRVGPREGTQAYKEAMLRQAREEVDARVKEVEAAKTEADQAAAKPPKGPSKIMALLKRNKSSSGRKTSDSMESDAEAGELASPGEQQPSSKISVRPKDDSASGFSLLHMPSFGRKSKVSGTEDSKGSKPAEPGALQHHSGGSSRAGSFTAADSGNGVTLFSRVSAGLGGPALTKVPSRRGSQSAGGAVEVIDGIPAGVEVLSVARTSASGRSALDSALPGIAASPLAARRR